MAAPTKAANLQRHLILRRASLSLSLSLSLPALCTMSFFFPLETLESDQRVKVKPIALRTVPALSSVHLTPVRQCCLTIVRPWRPVSFCIDCGLRFLGNERSGVFGFDNNQRSHVVVGRLWIERRPPAPEGERIADSRLSRVCLRHV